MRGARSGRRPLPAGLSAAMFSAELDPMRPRPSASCPLPKLPIPGRPRLPLPMRAAACRNCNRQSRRSQELYTFNAHAHNPLLPFF